MKYITIEDAKKKHCEICKDNNVCYRDFETCPEVKAFDLIPTVDVEEVKKTFWEYKGDFTYHCSCCDSNIYTPRLSAYTYCPNCGAQMKGKHE